MDIKIREANAGDKNFIYATWLRGLYHGSDFYGSIDKEAFFTNYTRVLDLISNKTNVKALVACFDDEPGIILAYVVLEPSTLHWAYCKESWRKQGIIRKLLSSSDLNSVTHLTKIGNVIRLNKKLVFNPFLI